MAPCIIQGTHDKNEFRLCLNTPLYAARQFGLRSHFLAYFTTDQIDLEEMKIPGVTELLVGWKLFYQLTHVFTVELK